MIFFVYFKAEILRVNDDLSRVLEFYRKIFGVVQSSIPESTPTSAEQAQRTSVTSPGGASTLIDLGAANQSAESVEAAAVVSSVLENELKALGKGGRWSVIYVNHLPGMHYYL